MADTPTANRWTFFTSLVPTIDGLAKGLMALVWMALGAGSLAGYQAVNPAFKPPALVLPATDAPKPVASALASSPSVAALEAAAYRYDTKLEAIEAQLKALLARLPETPADPPKAKGGKKAKAATPPTIMGEIKKLDPFAK